MKNFAIALAVGIALLSIAIAAIKLKLFVPAGIHHNKGMKKDWREPQIAQCLW